MYAKETAGSFYTYRVASEYRPRCVGRPWAVASATLPSSPLWRRWRIRYDASLDQFKQRAKHLDELREQPSPVRSTTLMPQNHGGMRRS